MENTLTATSVEPVQRRFLARLASNRGTRIWLFTLGLALAAVLLYDGAIRGVSAPAGPVRIPWWGIAVVFLLAEAYPVHLQFRTEAHSLSLSEIGLVLGLFLTSPGGLITGQLCGAAAALIVIRRQRPLKVAFNLAQFTFGTCLALVIFHAVSGLGDPYGVAGWAGALAGAAAFGAAGVALVGATISLAEGRSMLGELPHVTVTALVGSVAGAGLAIAAVELLQQDTRAVWVLFIPAASCVLAFRAYTEQRRRHEHLEFLYRSMRAMQGAPESRAAVRELLGAARAMLCAEFAEMVLFAPTAAEGALRSVMGPGRERILEPTDLSPVERAALEVASAEEAALVFARGHEELVLEGYLAEHHLRDAMLTALWGEDRILGLLLVGNRAGDVATFNSDDRKLFETFASHAAVLLENDRVKEQLRHQAFHDALTGLPNRRLFAEQVGEALARAAAEGTTPTVLFLDLDDFKTINDSLGHSAGDELLIEVAERVRRHVRPEDTAARLGGDEFGILVESARAGDEERVAERLVNALGAPIVLHGAEMSIHASIGIANARSGATTADDLLRNADVAMYSAKSNGKRGYAVYEQAMHTPVRKRHDLAAALEHAVERDEIGVQYQPIVDLTSGRTVALEALVRWWHRDQGLIMPGSFIPLAEETGLMVPIGRTVLREACARTSAWQAMFAAHSQLAICVNLAPSELQNPSLAADVAAVLDETDLAPDRLILEITENGAMRDPLATIETLRELRTLGVRLALDDFGTGHSSLSHLRDFPITMLKIAKPFVDTLGNGRMNTTFIDAIFQLARALELEAVAEGVEWPAQSEILCRLRCDLGQGYYFSRPLDVADAEAHLAASSPTDRPHEQAHAA